MDKKQNKMQFWVGKFNFAKKEDKLSSSNLKGLWFQDQGSTLDRGLTLKMFLSKFRPARYQTHNRPSLTKELTNQDAMGGANLLKQLKRLLYKHADFNAILNNCMRHVFKKYLKNKYISTQNSFLSLTAKYFLQTCAAKSSNTLAKTASPFMIS